MQFKFAAFSVLSALTTCTLVAANHGANSCNTGSLTCCNSVQDAHSKQATALLSQVGVAAEDVTGQVGITCSPISVASSGGSSCSATPVCCQNNSFNGVVALGCVNVHL